MAELLLQLGVLHDAYEAMLGRSDRSYPGRPGGISEYLPILRVRRIA